MMEIVEIQEDNTKGLYEASIRGCVTTLNTLLQRDELILDRTSFTFFKETPLHISCLLGHLDFSKEILRHKPRLASVLDSQGHFPLHSAAAEGHTEIVKALLKVNPHACLAPNQHGLIPLHLAATRGRIEVVRELVRVCPYSVHVKLQGSKETVLHLCVKYNQIDALKLLVRSMNGDPESLNSADNEGNTIGQLALMMKQDETMKFLASIPEVRVETAAESKGNELTRYLDNQSKWIKNTRGHLMIVATVIASMAFQASINPPGGVWQADVANCTAVGQTCKVGTSVLGYTDEFTYHVFISLNTVCFCLSLGIILLLIGLPLKNRTTMVVLLIAMCVTMLFLAGTYIAGVEMVGVPQDNTIYSINVLYSIFWFGLLIAIFGYHVLGILYWVVNNYFVVLFYCLVIPFFVLWKLISKVARKASADEPPANRV